MLNQDNRGGLTRRPQQGNAIRPYGSGTGTGQWHPFHEMEEMHRRMDDLFSQVFGVTLPDLAAPRWGGPANTDSEPDVDIYENDNEFIIHAFLPGVDQNDIDIQATETTISLVAETRSPFDQQNQQNQQTQSAGNQGAQDQSAQQGSGTTTAGGGSTTTSGASGSEQARPQPHTQHRQSRYSRYNRFQFAYTLPEEIRPNDVRAQFRNGRLELHLPKMQKAQQAGTVRIPISGAQQSSPQITGAGTGSSSTTAERASSQNQGQDTQQTTNGQSHRRGGDSADTDQQPTTGAKSTANSRSKAKS